MLVGGAVCAKPYIESATAFSDIYICGPKHFVI